MIVGISNWAKINDKAETRKADFHNESKWPGVYEKLLRILLGGHQC